MKNRYFIKGDITELILDRMDGTYLVTLIETADLERVKEYPGKWHASYNRHTRGYRALGNVTDCHFLHRWIMQPPKNKVVDHINHDGLDNRRCNLAVVTNAENLQNRAGLQSNNKSGYPGVSWSTVKNAWECRIKVKGVYKFLGYRKDLQEAVQLRKKAEEKYHRYKQTLRKRAGLIEGDYE